MSFQDTNYHNNQRYRGNNRNNRRRNNKKMQRNIDIFNDTMHYSKQLTKPTLLQFDKSMIKNVANIKDIINVWDENCIIALKRLQGMGYKNTAILDMASGYSPGGGIKKGSNAQEEFLCRISNLYVGLNNAKKFGFYPLRNPFIVKGVTFFKDENYQKCPNIVSDVLVCHAIKLKRTEIFDRNDKIITMDRIRNMLELCISNGNRAIVLSAFGCGAYSNPPAVIAQCFYNVLIEEQYASYFDIVVFAIIEDHNSDGANLRPFQNTFS